MTTRTVTSGGRTLAYSTWGDPDGLPVFSLHGTPGCRLNRIPDEDGVRSTGAHVITYDRPGYGQSDRHPGRRVVDCVEDVQAIADDLGLDRFAVTGGSGGGPHCLAVAARLADRVLVARCVVGVAPWGAPGLDWFGGMDPENVKEFGWALEGESALVPELQREADGMLARVAQDPATLLGDFELSEADRAALSDAGVQAVITEALPETFRHGVWGWVDDDLAFTLPWGFELDELRVPVQVWYGETDVLVPAAHGQWLAANVPGAEVKVDREGGHMGDPAERVAQLRSLVEAAQARARA